MHTLKQTISNFDNRYSLKKDNINIIFKINIIVKNNNEIHHDFNVVFIDIGKECKALTSSLADFYTNNAN
jgi:hypothetical protein